MRIKITYSPNNTPVPISNQHMLNAYIHKSLGRDNEYHDIKSNYNISHLYGGKLDIKTNTLDFSRGGYIIISSLDTGFINSLLIGIINNPVLFHGMSFNGVEHINETFMDGWNHFITLSPFIIKEYVDKKKYKFYTLKDDGFEKVVKDYLVNKVSMINPKLDLSDFEVLIPKHEHHKVKSILVKNVINRGSHCQISIKTNKAVAELLYNIGIGQSTGSGFGCIYKTENHSTYKNL
jgi:CRISPR-associated endoribonuclease Cas6